MRKASKALKKTPGKTKAGTRKRRHDARRRDRFAEVYQAGMKLAPRVWPHVALRAFLAAGAVFDAREGPDTLKLLILLAAYSAMADTIAVVTNALTGQPPELIEEGGTDGR